MTDRELLELAAKAAGIDVRWYDSNCLRVSDKCNGFAGKWNPLTDDGDALRLAVKVNLRVGLGEATGRSDNPTVCALASGPDPYAATRRAIVCAAADIGKTK